MTQRQGGGGGLKLAEKSATYYLNDLYNIYCGKILVLLEMHLASNEISAEQGKGRRY
jgi:hypothetical protein